MPTKMKANINPSEERQQEIDALSNLSEDDLMKMVVGKIPNLPHKELVHIATQILEYEKSGESTSTTKPQTAKRKKPPEMDSSPPSKSTKLSTQNGNNEMEKSNATTAEIQPQSKEKSNKKSSNDEELLGTQNFEGRRRSGRLNKAPAQPQKCVPSKRKSKTPTSTAPNKKRTKKKNSETTSPIECKDKKEKPKQKTPQEKEEAREAAKEQYKINRMLDNEAPPDTQPLVKEKRSQLWEERFQQFADHVYEHGLERKALVAVPVLKKWCDWQRYMYKKNKLATDRIKRLEELGFEFKSEKMTTFGMSNHEKWVDKYQQLLEYQKENGHTYLPDKYAPNPALSSWASDQRCKFKKGTLSAERIELLTDIGFDLESRGNPVPEDVLGMSLEDRWNYRYEQLLEYYENHKDCNVPSNYAPNLPLGHWVCNQRQRYRKQSIPESQAKKLDEIGFVWTVTKIGKEKEGAETGNEDGDVETVSVLDETSKKNNKDEDSHSQWETYYSELEQYQQKYNNSVVPDTFPSNPALGVWVRKQKKLKKDGLLSEDCVARLSELGFKWEPKAKQGENCTKIIE